MRGKFFEPVFMPDSNGVDKLDASILCVRFNFVRHRSISCSLGFERLMVYKCTVPTSKSTEKAPIHCDLLERSPGQLGRIQRKVESPLPRGRACADHLNRNYSGFFWMLSRYLLLASAPNSSISCCMLAFIRRTRHGRQKRH